MKARFSQSVRFLFVGGAALWLGALGGLAQTSLPLSARLSAGYAGLSITGAVGTACLVQYVTNLAQTNAWLSLTNLTLASNPQLWMDTSGPATGRRFYRTLAAPTNLVWILPGTFDMGSPGSEAERGTDETQHTVTLTKGFGMGKYAVTQGEYLALMGTNPSYFNGDRSGSPYDDINYGIDLTRPVEQVSWDDATNYCARLTQQERAAGRLLAGWAYRLPTESEWEYACRAGTTTAFHYGSALLNGMANFDTSNEYDAEVGSITTNTTGIGYLGRTTAVGSYQPNAWGLYDMHGNLWEWCLDWYGAYPPGSVSDPPGGTSGPGRVDRGGGWGTYGTFCRSAQRSYDPPSDGQPYAGFRVVLAQGKP